MNEFVFSARYQEQPVRVRIGWDRPLQSYFLHVEYTGHKDQLAYSSTHDPAVSRYTELSYFIKKALEMGMRVPRAAVHGLTLAPLHDGTAKSANGSRRVTREDWNAAR